MKLHLPQKFVKWHSFLFGTVFSALTAGKINSALHSILMAWCPLALESMPHRKWTKSGDFFVLPPFRNDIAKTNQKALCTE